MKKESLQINAEYFENVITCQVLTNSFYASLVYDHLSIEHFKAVGNRLIVGIIKDFYGKRKCLPTVTEIRSYLKKDEDLKLLKDTLTVFKQIDLNCNIDELVSNTETFFRERAVLNAVSRVINDDNLSTTKVLDLFEQACNITLVNDIGLDFYGDYKKVIEEMGKTSEVLPTGWGFIDNKIGGGLLKNGRALYLFLGPTNVGKSIFLGNIASNFASKGLTTVLITLEMPEMVYAKRISSHLSKIPIKDIHTQTPSLEDYFKGVAEERKQKLIIKEFPPKSVTVGNIRSYVESLVKKGIKPDVLVIDYLGLLKASSGDNSYEQGKNTSEELRALSYFFNIPIVSAIQTNREGMENPTLDTVSESLGVAFTADVVWGIYQEEGDMDLGIIKVKGIKNRLGPRHGATAMRIDYSTLSLTEENEYIGLSKTDKELNEMSNLERKLEKLER